MTPMLSVKVGGGGGAILVLQIILCTVNIIKLLN
jgi:hypothetical protein